MLEANEIEQLEHIHPLAIHKHIAKHLRKHFSKHAHKYMHVAQHVHHAFLHCGELMLVLLVGLSGIMFANFTGSLEGLERNSSEEIASYLLQAINHPENILIKGNMISVWKMDGSVENTFSKGYCTYGAARISPEFFPFTDETKLTQQRTRGGNAVNRCENAAATGYKIGNTPVQGALVVYDAGGRFGQYGHVGKIMHYDRSLKKIIVRDMAWVSMYTMSDRWDNTENSNIKCYIYNSRSATAVSGIIPEDTPSQTVIPPMTNTTTTTGMTDINQQHSVAPTTNTTPTEAPTTIQPPIVVTPTAPVSPVVPTTPQTPVVTPPVVIPSTPIVSNSEKTIELRFDDIIDYLAQHYIGQWDMEAEVNKTTLKIGDVATITITIKDKNTQENINGLLPLLFEFITSNGSISVDYSSIKLITDGKIEIHVEALQVGKASVIINVGDVKIGRAGFTVE